ncbi:uncharacterized protein LOC141910379 [Tubulanus polymorphus]|uniref:uncharacterized protein LOC141910379 n=1 Tax=Tubulanus polymorphus TaxID=672921 RepID=UPI003DA2CD2A
MKLYALTVFCCVALVAVVSAAKSYVTQGGNAGGAMCRFPFTFQGKKYYNCTRLFSNNVPWCGVTLDYDTDKRWGYCVQDDESCDCNYSNGGCYVVKAAPWNKACKCRYRGAWTCSGSVTTCMRPGSPECQNPTKSFASCLNGGGDCQGYKCDCDYKRGGCKISSVPTSGSACKCIYKGFWTCRGQSVKCKNEKDAKCIKPDFSYATCKLGGGDCGGY